MTVAADILPIRTTLAPQSQAELAAAVAEAHAREEAVYPIGGGTSLGYGLAPTRNGVALSLGGVNRLIDYPARDMTITVEAGMTMQALADTLAAERQWLPIDVPMPSRATVGGVVATAFSGPRRYAHWTIRDFVIGITAVDGRGSTFHGGGRVVKNVAGYDFCKLLSGSLGTLGIITQLSLKIRQQPERSAFLVADVPNLDAAERLLAALVDSATTPAAVELLIGPAWRDHAALGLLPAGAMGRLAVGLEGTHDEVEWMLARLADEWRELGATSSRAIVDSRAAQLWRDLAEFPAASAAPLVVKAAIRPGSVSQFVAQLQSADPQASIQAHAGNGIVIARFAKFDAGDVSRVLIGRLQPGAELAGGHVTVLSSMLEGLTRQAVWGGVSQAHAWMAKVRSQFDPRGILNPGRFVYTDA